MYFNKNKFYEKLSENLHVTWKPNDGSQTLYLSASNFVFSEKEYKKYFDSKFENYKNVLKFDEKKLADINEILYHGGRGIGKTEVVLAEFASLVGRGYGDFLQGIVFRKTYKELRDVFNKAKRFFNKEIFKGVKINKSPNYEIIFPTGEKLIFGHMYSENDYDLYHGNEFSFIWFEEVTLWSSPDVVNNMYSCLRLHDTYNKKYEKEIECGLKEKLIGRMRMTTNPYGAGKDWVKKSRIDNIKNGEFYINNGRTCISIKGHFLENTCLKEAYFLSLNEITNKQKKNGWMYGDWTAKSGGMFGDLFDASIFVKSPFKIPSNWYVDKSLDFGTSSPFSVLFFAESNGEEFVINKEKNLKMCVPKGSIFVIEELYGATQESIEKGGRHQGLNLTPSEICKLIKEKESFIRRKIFYGEIEAGAADNAITADTSGRNNKTIYDMFKSDGIKWQKSDKSKGSRINGVNVLIEMMKNTIQNNDKPHIYFFDSCINLIENVFCLERDAKNPDDVDSSGNDHDYDALRYRITYKRETTKSGSLSSFK